ncbi:MAG: hypothetical protein NVS4B11_38280 [Ktedonobacteraceae bacterium]
MDGKVTYHQQMSYCGKAHCRKCRNGAGHGPYWYAFQTVNGRVKRTYIGKELPPEMMHLVGTELAPPPAMLPPPDQLPTGRIHRNPLVGREKEHGILHTLLLQVERNQSSSVAQNKRADLPLDTQRHSQCVVLLGEVGIGKTRLAEELGREAQQRGWAVLWSRAYSQESGIPYRVWSDILRKALDVQSAPPVGRGTSVGTDPARPSRGSIGDEDVLDQSLQIILPELWVPQRALGIVEPEQEQLRLREVVSRLLTTMSQKKPLLIVLDDIQWADGSSCELLGYLARHVHGSPILLLATCRENETPKALTKLIDHMQREHTITTLHIDPLTREEIGQLVEHLPSHQVQHIQLQAAGNPFFAEELARTTPPKLPDTISAALSSRMNSLSNECRTLLKNAAVLGSSFEFPLIHALEVKHIGEHTDEDALFDLLEEALAAGVLTEEGVGARVTYSFWHPLMVTHLYESVSAVRRTHIHRRVADILLRMHRGHEADVAATIAHHLMYGGAGSVHVAHYAEVAGDHAYALLAYPEAERYYKIALDAALKASHRLGFEADTASMLLAPSHLALLTEHLAESVMVQGRFAEARSLFERVITLRYQDQEQRNEPLLPQGAQVHALLWGEIGRTWLYLGDRAKARQCYERGEQVLQQTHVLIGFAWARLRTLQGGLFAQEGNYTEALSVAKEALRLFQAYSAQHHALPYDLLSSIPLTRIQRTLNGDPNDLGRIYMLLGSVYNSMGQLNNALSQLTTAMTMFEQRDQKREIANASCNIGYISLKKAEFVLAQKAFERSLAIAEYIGDGPISSVVFRDYGELAVCRGNLEEAEGWYKRALTLAEQFKDRTYISIWSAELAVILQAQQKSAEATTYLIRAVMGGRAIQNNLCIGNALLALAQMRIIQAQHLRASSQPDKKHTLLLKHAYSDAQRALLLTGLGAETYTKARLVMAHALLLLGDTIKARGWLEDVVERAHSHNLALIEQQAWDLLDQINKG